MIITKTAAIYTHKKPPLNLLLTLTCILSALGFLFVYSSSSVYAFEHYQTARYFLYKQLLGFIIGIIGFTTACFIPLRMWYTWAPLLYIGSLIITGLTLISGIGRTLNGSSRWIGYKGLSVQSSETLKIALIIYIASLITKKEHNPPSLVFNFLPCILAIGVPTIILLKQPDFGLAVTLAATASIMMLVAGYQTRYLLYSMLASIPTIVALVAFRPYRLKRILIFFNPWQDPQGAGFQIIQSLIAIGSGGLWGTGIAGSKQKFFYLPMQHTDFIFSIIAEEIGFIGSCTIIFLYALMAYCGISIAWHCQSRFAQLVIVGCTTLLSLEALINLAVSTGMAPTKGIGLPFISYGNSALACHITIIGIIYSIARSDWNTTVHRFENNSISL
jgi:cell division protein FtsW